MKEIKPDFIYIHLGINDLQAQPKRSPSQIIECYAEFLIFRSHALPNTKVIFSLPLLPADTRLWDAIFKLHAMTERFISEIVKDELPEQKDRLTFLNRNSNFRTDEAIIRELLARDGLHPSASGQRELSHNIRFVIHKITRAILGPKQRRSVGANVNDRGRMNSNM